VGFGSYSSVICGIDWLKNNSASIKIANMSLGGRDDRRRGGQ